MRPVSLGTPYVTPPMIQSAPTGVNWSIIPRPKALPQEIAAELTNICWKATSVVDTFCGQPLRATVDNEQVSGPGSMRVGFQNGTGNTLLTMRRWPVVEVLAVQTCPSRTFPRAWTPIPAGLYEPTRPLLNSFIDSVSATMPDGGNQITVASGYVDWSNGRNGWQVLSSYVNGWPHASLTADAVLGATTLAVDDVTGFAGASAFVYDGANTEPLNMLTATATTPVALPGNAGVAHTGPGTVTLSAPTAYAHEAGTVVSALPANVQLATIWAAMVQALDSGIVSVTIQNLPGSETVGGHGIEELTTEYEALLTPFCRVV